MAAGSGDGPVLATTDEPAPLRRTGSEPRLAETLPPTQPAQKPPDLPALLSTVPAAELTAVRTSAARHRQSPSSHPSTMDSAIELLLQAHVTLEWDVSGADGRTRVDSTYDGERDLRGLCGGRAWHREGGLSSRRAGAVRRRALPPVLEGELSLEAGVMRTLGHAWTYRPSLLPGLFPRRPLVPLPSRLEMVTPPPVLRAGAGYQTTTADHPSTRPGDPTTSRPADQTTRASDHDTRSASQTTTSLADLLQLMKVAAATRPQAQPVTPAAGGAPWHRRGARPIRRAASEVLPSLQTGTSEEDMAV